MITLLSSNATNMSPSLVSITDSTTSPPLSKTTNYDAPKRNISSGFATLGRWCHHWWVWQRKYSSSGFAQMHLRRGCSCTVHCALCSESYPSDKAVDAEKRRKVQRSLVASKCPFKCQITSSVPPSVRSLDEGMALKRNWQCWQWRWCNSNDQETKRKMCFCEGESPWE